MYWSGVTLCCAICLHFSSCYLKISVFLGYPFPGPLAKESRNFEGFLLSAPISISGLLALSVPSLRVIWQKQYLRNSPVWLSLGCKVLSQSAFFFSPFQSLVRFILYIMPRVLAVLNGRNIQKYISSIFLEEKSFY